MRTVAINNRRLIAVFWWSIWLVSCNHCGDALKSRAVSSDGHLVASFYERNCGATADFSSMVNVQSASDKFDGDEGRLFVAKGRYDISVTWTGPKALLISCTGCSRNNIFREVSVEGDLDVSYSLGLRAPTTSLLMSPPGPPRGSERPSVTALRERPGRPAQTTSLQVPSRLEPTKPLPAPGKRFKH